MLDNSAGAFRPKETKLGEDMGVLMLIVAMSAAGEASIVALQFPTMAQCESMRPVALQAVREAPGAKAVEFIAAVCVQPARLEDI